MTDISHQKLIFFTGKGGVGKSILSAAKASFLRQQGHSVLHVEMGSSQFLKTLYNADIQQSPTLIQDNLYASSFNTTDCIKEFIQFYLKSDKIASVFTDSSVVQNMINSAPGLSDLTLLGKITSGIVKIGPPLNFDHLVIDSYSTGHFKALIKAGLSMSESFQSGPIGDQSRSMINVLKKKGSVEFNLVGLPEQLAFEEVKDLQEFISKNLDMDSTILLNKTVTNNLNLSELPKAYTNNTDQKEFIEKLKSINFWQKKYFDTFSAQNIEWTPAKNLQDLVQKILIYFKETKESL